MSEQRTAFQIIGVLMLVACVVPRCDGEQTKRTFTVADDIGMTVVGKVCFSPDRSYFAVYSERGRLDLNQVEDSVAFYRREDVEKFLEHSDRSQRPSPIWTVNRLNKKGPVIKEWRWLPDSSGVAFLERLAGSNQRLVLVDLWKKTIKPLSSKGNTVGAFDIRDAQHYVYTVADRTPLQKMRGEIQAPAIVGTGRTAEEIIFPDDSLIVSTLTTYYLWAVVGGRRFEVKHDGAPLIPEGNLSLSPDGQSLVTQLVVPDVPLSWETLYPSPEASYPYRIQAGHQDLQSGWRSVRSYITIRLETGSVRSLTDAPESDLAGWRAGGSPSWSSDGRSILLPNTFLRSKDDAPSRACVAVVDLAANTRTCIEALMGLTEMDTGAIQHDVIDVGFINGDKQRVVISFKNRSDHRTGDTEYRRMPNGSWQVVRKSEGESDAGHKVLEIKVVEEFDRPSIVIARNKEVSRMIWDPNPQFKNIDLGLVTIYKWKDKEGRDRRGGMYKPANYKPGERYPLVIQTHGFYESRFIPSGSFPTAFAATELAASGIVVLQVADEEACLTVTPFEGPCAVSTYESAAKQLVSEGLVDPEKIGIIGFSRTCFYVMETLTTGSLHIRAASITDGTMAGYPEYLFFGDVVKEYDSLIGAKPFGDGLQRWLSRAPGFNLDKVRTPLLVVGAGPRSLLFMWEPYAGLRYLHKPVDLIILNTDEHDLTNPAVRMASQGGSVDWFRFWLKGEEDPDPAKVEQYERWRELQKVLQENETKLATPRAASN